MATQKPATWASAASAVTLRAWLPITMPSSTSQSRRVKPSGGTMSSSGPARQLVHLGNITGSAGTGMPDSTAWSW